LTGEGFLLEDGSVGAQIGALDVLTIGQLGAHMEHLTTGFQISVVTIETIGTGEFGFGNLIENGVVDFGLAGDGLAEVPEGHVVMVVFLVLGRGDGSR